MLIAVTSTSVLCVCCAALPNISYVHRRRKRGEGGAQGARAPPKMVHPCIFRWPSVTQYMHVHPECPPSMFLHQ